MIEDNSKTEEIEEIDLSETSKTQDEKIDEEIIPMVNQEELDKEKDKYIRLYSEFDNFKRRTSQEKAIFIQTANEKIVMDILPMLDDFKRAEPLSDGIELIRKNLIGTLKKHNVVAIECVGEKFDPEVHQALTQVPNEEMKGLIIEVIENGYKMGDKVIRFPKVIIGS